MVCIAPSMLGPPTSFSSERENRFIKKSTLLIQFLIESCCGMFGGEFTSPFGESSVRHATADRACDTSGPEMTAGPHSPESEPSEDSEASCSDLRENLGEGSGGTGCVFTLCDDDLDQPAVKEILNLNDVDVDFSKEQDIQKQQPLGSTPVAKSMASCRHMSPHDSPKNQPFHAETLDTLPPT